MSEHAVRNSVMLEPRLGLDCPPAIVLGVDTQIGLTVVRELGEHGVPVYGVAASKRGLGLYSRWLKRGYFRPDNKDDTVALLNLIARETGAQYVMTVSEADALLVAGAYEEGRLCGVKPLVPTSSLMTLVTDKMAMCETARDLGIHAPTTWQPERIDDLAVRSRALRYPCVLKWRSPNDVMHRLSEHGLPFLKAEYCYSDDDLARALRRYEGIGMFPLVQSYAPGRELSHMLFMHGGKALLRFQHASLGDWPPEGGFMTVSRSVSLSENSDLLARSEALLQHIGWEGAAMVEYRYHADDDIATFMEINGRFWGSQPLAYHAGAPFAWYTYAVLGLGEALESAPYKADVTCRFMVPEIRRLVTLFFRRGRIQDKAMVLNHWQALGRFFTDFLRPSTRYYVFSLRDPKPFFADLGFMAAKALRAVFRR